MRRSYVDTSALRHLLVAHVHTAEVRARVTDADTITATSQIAVTELHRLALREPQLTVPDVDAALDRVDLVVLTATQLRSAGLLPHPSRVRSCVRSTRSTTRPHWTSRPVSSSPPTAGRPTRQSSSDFPFI